jgi:fucose permease
VLLYALTYSFIEPDLAWRVMFAAGLLPALLIIYIRRGVQEPVPAATPDANANAMPISRFPLLDIFRPQVLRMTLIGGLLGVGAHGGYYALMTWLPTYLKTERHLSVLGTGGYLAVIIFAFWCGCVASAWLLDVLGRRGNILLFWCICSYRCRMARCWCWAFRWASLRRAFRPAWARCSTSCIRRACAARAWAFATTSAAWCLPRSRCWWAR